MKNTNTALFNGAKAQELMDNIKRVNDLLDVHIQAQSSDLILFQYEEMRKKYLEELNEMFHFYALVVKEKVKRKRKVRV